VNRREFCSSVTAATTLATCAAGANAALWSGDADPTTAVLPYRLIFDGRFPASRLLGAEAARRGLPAALFNGDVTALWFHDLGPHWAASRVPVAGITTPEALLCLEQMARDAWMRVTIRAEHAGSDAQPCRHRVTGRATDVARICVALNSGADWPTRLAVALTETSVAGGRQASRRRVVGDLRPGDRRVPRLVSWMITA
jgi:hypothetical protein